MLKAESTVQERKSSFLSVLQKREMAVFSENQADRVQRLEGNEGGSTKG